MSKIEIIECDGYPFQTGCNNYIDIGRTKWNVEGTKKNGWYVTHATEDFIGTPSKPLYLLYFCPSCAVIVHDQEERTGANQKLVMEK